MCEKSLKCNEKMEKDLPRCVQLEPFRHQVSGHHYIICYNETTISKPLVPREQEFYKTMPEELREFTPEYRGVMDVELQASSDGNISFMGYPCDECNSLILSHEKKPKHHNGLPSPVCRCSGGDPKPLNSLFQPQHTICSTSEHQRNDVRSPAQKKSCDVSESVFPLSKTNGLNPWSLKCHREKLEKLKKVGRDSDNYKSLLLENVAAKFKRPCILDLKMGTRQHRDGISEAKRNSQMKKCAATTSKLLGVRVCGMQVFQLKSGTFLYKNKYHGEKLRIDNFPQFLHLFLHSGYELRTSLIGPIVHRLEKLYALVKRLDTYRFYTSSLLIIYDGMQRNSVCDGLCDTANGDVSSSEEFSNADDLETCSMQSQTEEGLVDVKMIDFARTTHSELRDGESIRSGPDIGYLYGLENLIRLFRELHDKYSI